MITQFITFVAYAIVAKLSNDGPLSVSQIVASLSILTLLMDPLGQLLFALPQFFAALGCFTRVQEFLTTDDWQDSRDQHDTKKDPAQDERIVVEHATVQWPSDPRRVLDDVSFRCTRDTPITFILGPVGCGKSTLLKTLLGLASVTGRVWVHSRAVSYCEQSPWITSGTLRDCIVGQNAFEQEWYDSVVYACALGVDLQQLAKRDMAEVGSKGISLSGGQKQRIVRFPTVTVCTDD